MEMPGQIEVDVSVMTDVGSVIRVSDIVPPANVTILADSEEMVARIDVPRGAVGIEDEGGPEAGAGEGAA